MSQVLNSIYWDSIHHGKSHEEMLPLYCDIVTLDIMSGIEIDKAKKEFEVDTTKELRRMKDKYAKKLKSTDGRKKLPHFFAHIDRLKKYYDTDKRCYVKYDTTMDYVQTVINSFKTRVARDKSSPLIPFAEILNNYRLDTRYVNDTQVELFFDSIEEYITNRNKVYSIYEEPEYKRALNEYYKDHLLNVISSEKINYNTFYNILLSIENHPNNIKRIALQLLFENNELNFNKALAMAIEPIEHIELGGTDLFLYDIGFTRYSKTAEASINLLSDDNAKAI